MTETSQSTSLTETKLEAPQQEEINRIRKAGAFDVQRKKELREIAKTIEGLEWGTGSSAVKGTSLSPATRWAMAEFCRVTRANPMQHVDVLGSRPYLNAAYWSDLINQSPYFIEYNQREISEATEEHLRDRAEKLKERASTLEDSDPKKAQQYRVQAYALEDEADDLAMARTKWGVPEWATDVVETTIRRWIPAAPMDQIQSGEYEGDLDIWIREVAECNWAGGKGEYKREHHANNKSFGWDPIGDADPAKTARTRSLRRAAVKAFSAWMDKYETQIHRAEEAIEAEWEILEEDEQRERAALPDPGGPQAVSTGNGEPEAHTPEGAQELPVEEADGDEDAEGDEDVPSREEMIDRNRRAFFANLRDGPGIESDEARYEWAAEHDLPESTREWSLQQWQKANKILVADARKKFLEACEAMGVEDPFEYAHGHLERPPKMISDYRDLTSKLSAAADQEAADDAEQGSLV